MLAMRKCLLLLVAFAVAGCEERLTIMNDTLNPVEIDVVSRNRPRPAYLRHLDPGIAYDTKQCAAETAYVYIQRRASPVVRDDLAGFCIPNRCGCLVTVSKL